MAEHAGADPEAELAALAGALRARVRTRRRLGARKTRALPAAAPRAAAPAPERAPGNRSPERARAERTPSAAPAPAPAAARSAAPSPALAAAALKADENRALARGAQTLAELAAHVAACTACGLCRTRTQTVFSDGRARVRVMFVGEAPGENEDRQGVPFVGKAGALLTDIIVKGMGLAREDVYIANVLKCRPPDNRDPTEVEKRLCTPWLDRQIELVDPQVIIPLGRHAAMHVLSTEASMGALRGKVHLLGGRKVIPTYHPAYLLRDPSKKKECWQDIRLALSELGLAPPSARGGAAGAAER